MKNIKKVVIVLIILILGITVGIAINLKVNKKKIVSGYSFELSEKTRINKTLSGKYLDSFVTIIEKKDKFEINLEGIDPNSEVFVIDPTDGKRIKLENKEGKFFVETELQKDITYGIIMDYNLIGSIRVVEDIKNIEEEKLVQEILITLGCGI